jgi:hypothetical protein
MWTIEDLATDKINLSATFYCSFKKLQNPLEILDPETIYAVDYGYRRILQTMEEKNFMLFSAVFSQC